MPILSLISQLVPNTAERHFVFAVAFLSAWGHFAKILSLSLSYMPLKFVSFFLSCPFKIRASRALYCNCKWILGLLREIKKLCWFLTLDKLNQNFREWYKHLDSFFKSPNRQPKLDYNGVILALFVSGFVCRFLLFILDFFSLPLFIIDLTCICIVRFHHLRNFWNILSAVDVHSLCLGILLSFTYESYLGIILSPCLLAHSVWTRWPLP